MNENTMPAQGSPKSNSLLAVIGIVIVFGIIGYVVTQNNIVQAPEAVIVEETREDGEVIEDEATAEEGRDDDDVVETEVMEAKEGVVVVSLEASNFTFGTEEVTIKLGDTVRIEVEVAQGTHNFTLEEFDVKSDVTGAGKTIVVEFVADQIGEFEYYCGVGSHRQLGMVGTLTVEE